MTDRQKEATVWSIVLILAGLAAWALGADRRIATDFILAGLIIRALRP